jgi:hypothetical protein
VLQRSDPEVNGVSTWRLIDPFRIVQERFGVTYSETGMGKLMRNLDLVLADATALPCRNRARRPGAVQKGGFAQVLLSVTAATPFSTVMLRSKAAPQLLPVDKPR